MENLEEKKVKEIKVSDRYRVRSLRRSLVDLKTKRPSYIKKNFKWYSMLYDFCFSIETVDAVLSVAIHISVIFWVLFQRNLYYHIYSLLALYFLRKWLYRSIESNLSVAEKSFNIVKELLDINVEPITRDDFI